MKEENLRFEDEEYSLVVTESGNVLIDFHFLED